MIIRFFLFVRRCLRGCRANASSRRRRNPRLARKRRLPSPQVPVIRFEDASDKAGIDFTHSFGSRQLGSLLEGTGAGCIWFDYNNSGLRISLRGQRPPARRLDASVSAEGEAGIRRRTIISIATTATAHSPM